MIRVNQNITEVKQSINNFRDKHVNVRVDLGRNKILKYSGILSGIYPALFTVLPDDKNFLGKTAYSYSEILCGSVRICERKEI